MSLKLANQTLRDRLSDENIRVVALTGPWGTGKTELWKRLRENSLDDAIKGARYASLFGVQSIDEVRSRLVQASLPGINEKGPQAAALKATWKTAATAGKDVLKHASKSLPVDLSKLVDIQSLLTPFLLKKAFVVLDDIERKHDKLTVSELLGFIDDLAQNYETRVLLIMNSSELDDPKVWNEIREKVVDAEIQVKPTPEEAFNLAMTKAFTPYDVEARKAVVTCGITNIRTLIKINKILERLLGGVDGLPLKARQRIIPPIVFFAALELRSIPFDISPKEVISRFSGENQWSFFARQINQDSVLDEEGQTLVSVYRMIENLNIRSLDYFESLLADYVHTGFVDRDALNREIRVIRDNGVEADVDEALRDLVQKFRWSPVITPKQRLDATKAMLQNIKHASPLPVSQLMYELEYVDSSEEISSMILEVWTKEIRDKVQDGRITLDTYKEMVQHYSLPSIGLHTSVLGALKAAECFEMPEPTVKDIFNGLSQKNDRPPLPYDWMPLLLKASEAELADALSSYAEQPEKMKNLLPNIILSFGRSPSLPYGLGEKPILTVKAAFKILADGPVGELWSEFLIRECSAHGHSELTAHLKS